LFLLWIKKNRFTKSIKVQDIPFSITAPNIPSFGIRIKPNIIVATLPIILSI
jgi:hypothetical protein